MQPITAKNSSENPSRSIQNIQPWIVNRACVKTIFPLGADGCSDVQGEIQIMKAKNVRRAVEARMKNYPE